MTGRNQIQFMPANGEMLPSIRSGKDAATRCTYWWDRWKHIVRFALCFASFSVAGWPLYVASRPFVVVTNEQFWIVCSNSWPLAAGLFLVFTGTCLVEIRDVAALYRVLYGRFPVAVSVGATNMTVSFIIFRTPCGVSAYWISSPRLRRSTKILEMLFGERLWTLRVWRLCLTVTVASHERCGRT